jgi:hypothetical protein
MENLELEKIKPSVEDSPIAIEILEMARIDQDMRLNLSDKNKWDFSIDENNTARMKEIIEQIGWPTISKVGKSASNMAWLLVQHADHDSAFQEKCLNMLKQVNKGDVRKNNIAYLEDRVRVNTGRPILYGTQFFQTPEGDYGPREIEDRENLNKRRAEMGLEPFEEYEQKMQELYGEIEKRKDGD